MSSTIRKQKDKKWVEAGHKAAETRRKNLEKAGKGKDVESKPSKEERKKETTEPEEQPKWHITSQSTLTLKVNLPTRERLTDFCDQPWVEKYRPTCLNDCIGEVVGYLKAFVKTGSLPLCLIFHGSYGEGKTSSAKAMVRDYFVLRGLFKREATFKDITNASNVTKEFNGIFAPALLVDATLLKSAANGFSAAEVIRTRVQNFMMYSVGKWPKFIVIDEADRMGHDCQEILTSLIEKYPRTRTIWTCNDLNDIMDRIVSRAAGGVFEFKKPAPKEMLPRLRHIAKLERVRISEDKLKEIANNTPSVRDAIGMLQQQAVLIMATHKRGR